MQRSSAYARVLMTEFAILYRAPSAPSAARIRTSITRLKRIGLRGQPCLTPLLIMMGAVELLLVRAEVVTWW